MRERHRINLAGNKKNVLFLVIDAFRFDRCFGKEKTSKTPCIDQLIKNGISFEQNISSADGTAPSIASILSAKHPFNIAERGGLFQFKLKKDVPLLTSILKENGYNCFATIPNVWFNKEYRKFFDNVDFTYPTFERLHNGLGNKILDKLSKIKSPWFYYVHLEDTHKPISYPDSFDEKKFGEDEYDRVISFVDSWLKKFLEKIDKENTLVVITSDHGDYIRSITINEKRISFEFKSASKPILKISDKIPISLWTAKTKTLLWIRDTITKIKLAKINGLKLTPYQQRSLFGARSDPNKKLFDDTFHVPLIIYGTSMKDKKIKNLVRSIDIFPTIFNILNIPIKHKIDGRNLWPLVEGKNLEEEPAYIEGAVNINNDAEGAIGIRTSTWKYFRRIKNKEKAFLFDLENDKLEESNLFKKNDTKAREMEEILQNLLKNEKEAKMKFEERSSEEEQDIEEELRKLGYI